MLSRLALMGPRQGFSATTGPPDASDATTRRVVPGLLITCPCRCLHVGRLGGSVLREVAVTEIRDYAALPAEKVHITIRCCVPGWPEWGCDGWPTRRR